MSYKLPDLKYPYDALEPYYTANMLYLHHDILHKGYTDNLNKTLAKLEEMRNSNNYENIKALEKDLSFNGSGYILHNLFFDNLTPPKGSMPSGILLNKIVKDFGSSKSFVNQLLEATSKIEGSGWGILGYSKDLDKLFVLQIEKHQDLSIIGIIPLLVLDIWEHAYYLQYTTDKMKYLHNLMQIIDWDVVNKRFEEIKDISS